MYNAYFINHITSCEQEFNHTACNPNNNIVIKACAGSGKTWLLCSRILRILIEGENIENILAITFTTKAANEMQHRILEWLKNFSCYSDEELKHELKLRGIIPKSQY